ncbi:hypothetical protein NHX12_022584, partial [Muraenolepis orangiensis]
MSELQLKEVREVVRKARASSAPGPSGTSYKVYKYCPKLLLRLWYILRVFWRRGRIPDQWRVAEGVWIPKEENSTQLDQFRIISLLCVEAKVFFSAVSKRLCTYLAENNYIDTSVQKGGISGMPGCLEHTGVVTQLIREARENKGNLSVLWLDLENAFGSIPHKLVQFTLTKHHVPSRCRDLIADYYSNFRMRVSSGEITSSWHNVEIGIITGCTISVTLFSLAMNMLTKSAEPECRGPRTNSGQRQPPIRAFMDDLTVMTESVPGCRWILKGLEELVEWARMRFKPAKSRSMVLRKGKVVDKFRFNIADTAIPSISEKPVKSLGKVFDCSLRDTTSIQSTCTELDGWLKSVDKSGLPGKFKAWVYQHGILPRILWPLLVYAVPISTVETLERRGECVEGSSVSGALCIKQSWPGMARTIYGDHQRFLDTYFKPYPGHYFTGDGAYRSADGFYQITGRMDDVINFSGHRLGTAEIEDALEALCCKSLKMDHVMEVVVRTVNFIRSRVPFAFLVLKEDVSQEQGVVVEELRRLVATKIAKYAIPDHFLTRSGKILRRILGKVALEQTGDLGDVSTLDDPSV